MFRLAALFVAALAIAAPASAAQFAPTEDGLILFQLPSGNIGCIFVPEGGTPVYTPPGGHAELQCDRVEPTYKRVILGTSGKAKAYNNVGDASCCGYLNVLEYGETWRMGPFTCASATTGLTCSRGSHGLTMSRKAVTTW